MSAEIDTHALAAEVAELIAKPAPPLLDADQASVMRSSSRRRSRPQSLVVSFVVSF